MPKRTETLSDSELDQVQGAGFATLDIGGKAGPATSYDLGEGLKDAPKNPNKSDGWAMAPIGS